MPRAGPEPRGPGNAGGAAAPGVIALTEAGAGLRYVIRLIQKGLAMNRSLAAALAFAAGLAALPQLAAAQTDFATVGKVSCVPDKVTRCSEPGKCTTRDASPGDKAQVLIIDFAGKQVSMKRGDNAREVGKVTEDKIDGGVRMITMKEGEGPDGRTARMTLAKDGKLSIDFGGAGNKAEATCTAAS
jgi:hypothetical protein